MNLSLMVLMLNTFFVGWCMARDDMLWMSINAVFAALGMLSLMRRMEPAK